MSLEGKTIGNRYEILEKIGVGGMATVYKAKDNILKRNVAIKVLRDEFTTDEEFIKRFNTEAQSAASLTHPNIVSIYDVGHEENLYFIVMELIKGKTLKQIITEEGALPWKWSVNIAMQIASALETAHKNNINVKIGTVHTTDVFYNQELDQRVKDNYSLVAEMECFALFYMAKQFDKQAAAILTVSDNIITKESLSSKDREQTFDEAITLALESTL